MKIKDIAIKYNINGSQFEKYVRENKLRFTLGAFSNVSVEDSDVEQYVAMFREHHKTELGIRTEAEESAREMEERARQIIVTTGDLKQDYEIIGPVYFQISNKGLFSSALSQYIKKYQDDLARLKQAGQISVERPDWGFLYGEWSVGQNDFDKAFYVATQELKARAAMLGADAVICMRQDIDLDTNGFTFFYLQMYGTAVRFK